MRAQLHVREPDAVLGAVVATTPGDEPAPHVAVVLDGDEHQGLADDMKSTGSAIASEIDAVQGQDLRVVAAVPSRRPVTRSAGVEGTSVNERSPGRAITLRRAHGDQPQNVGVLGGLALDVRQYGRSDAPVVPLAVDDRDGLLVEPDHGPDDDVPTRGLERHAVAQVEPRHAHVAPALPKARV